MKKQPILFVDDDMVDGFWIMYAGIVGHHDNPCDIDNFTSEWIIDKVNDGFGIWW